LFDIFSTSSFNADKLVEGDDYDYVTRTSLNQGVLKKTGYVNADNINEKGTWSLGLLQMDFFYRKRKWYAGQFVRKIVPKIEVKDGAILFFSTIFNMQKPKLLSVLVRDVNNIFLNSIVKLPVKNGEIDFDFMEAYVRELEEERVRELEEERVRELSAYLKVSGLDNYELSEEEKQAINKLDTIKFEKFNLEMLFGKSTRGKRLKSAERVNGNLPFVTAGETDEGISAFIGNNVDIFEKNTTTIDMFGSAKYRNYQYGGDDHVAIVHTEKLPMNAAIFVTSAIHKVSHNGQFDYGRNFYAKDADALDILLPIKNLEPDYEYMALVISAVHKLVIKDVILWADKNIGATKMIVGRDKYTE